MSTRRKAVVIGIICFGSLSVVTALCRFIVQKQLIADQDTPLIMGRMIIVAAIEIQIAVIAVNLPALRSLFTKLVGSSHDPASYGQGDAHRLSSLKSSDNRQLKGVFGGSRRPNHALGATLTGSEEELMRQGENMKGIYVSTNVNISIGNS